MTGSGTQQDPYKPSTWAEVLSCTTSDSVYTDFPVSLVKTRDIAVDQRKIYLYQDGTVVQNPRNSEIGSYYENTFIFDMNDYYPEGIVGTIPLRGFINGRGATIKNAYYSGDEGAFLVSSQDYLGKISYLNFINFRFATTTTDRVFIEGPETGNVFYRCKFSGRVENNGAQWCAITRGNYFTSLVRCSYNIEIKGIASIDTGNWSGTCRGCDINVIGLTDNDTLGITPNNTYVSGEIHTLSIEGTNGNAYESIIDVEAASIISNNGDPAVTFINTDKYSGSLPGGCTGATTAQLKNADWLRSQGFPIQT